MLHDILDQVRAANRSYYAGEITIDALYAVCDAYIAAFKTWRKQQTDPRKRRVHIPDRHEVLRRA